MISNYFAFFLRVIHNNIIKVAVIVLMISANMFLFVNLIDISIKANKSAIQYNNNYGKTHFYCSGDAFEGDEFNEYWKTDSRNLYDKLKTFETLLRNDSHFSYVEAIEQPFEIIGMGIDDVFLYNYETGFGNDSIYKIGKDLCYCIKALEVSSEFFEVFDICISKGRSFDNSDYISNDKNVIPVLLGSDYSDCLSIGDSFDVYYMCEKYTCNVIGFIKEDSFFYDNSTSNMISCNRYIIAPALDVDDRTDFSRALMDQKLNCLICSDRSADEVKIIYDSLLAKAGLDNSYYFFNDIQFERSNNVFNTCSSMTKDVAFQTTMCSALIIVLSCLSIAMMICTLIRNNRDFFVINILFGASLKDVVLMIGLFVFIIVFIADAVDCMILHSMNNNRLLVTLQIMTLSIGALIAILSCFFFSKQDDFLNIGEDI
ncbi:hypothetical protein [Butyrivibrio sp. MC2013]|uniref:hypothetical protein n=1 Tax=Butyrivibrio sp. MC2013 TaxID=1280686 RepID=UPI000401FBF1|nr:hypothetical protein [Butyrivibrio sp. MC2013]